MENASRKFFKIYKDMLPHDLSLTAHLVYSYRDSFNENNRPFYASNKTIAKELKTSEKTVERSITTLKRKGLWAKKAPKLKGRRTLSDEGGEALTSEGPKRLVSPMITQHLQDKGIYKKPERENRQEKDAGSTDIDKATLSTEGRTQEHVQIVPVSRVNNQVISQNLGSITDAEFDELFGPPRKNTEMK